MTTFGSYIRKKRTALANRDPSFSVRQVAKRIQVQPSFLSKVERDLQPPPSAAKVRALATELGDDPDMLLAMAGKVSEDLKTIIMRRPEIFADVIRQLDALPDHAVLRVVREVRDGDW